MVADMDGGAGVTQVLDIMLQNLRLGPVRSDWDEADDEVEWQAFEETYSCAALSSRSGGRGGDSCVESGVGVPEQDMGDLPGQLAPPTEGSEASFLEPHFAEPVVDLEQVLQTLLLQEGLLEDHDVFGPGSRLASGAVTPAAVAGRWAQPHQPQPPQPPQTLRELRRTGALGELSDTAQTALLGGTLYAYEDSAKCPALSRPQSRGQCSPPSRPQSREQASQQQSRPISRAGKQSRPISRAGRPQSPARPDSRGRPDSSSSQVRPGMGTPAMASASALGTLLQLKLDRMLLSGGQGHGLAPGLVPGPGGQSSGSTWQPRQRPESGRPNPDSGLPSGRRLGVNTESGGFLSPARPGSSGLDLPPWPGSSGADWPLGSPAWPGSTCLDALHRPGSSGLELPLRPGSSGREFPCPPMTPDVELPPLDESPHAQPARPDGAGSDMPPRLDFPGPGAAHGAPQPGADRCAFLDHFPPPGRGVPGSPDAFGLAPLDTGCLSPALLGLDSESALASSRLGEPECVLPTGEEEAMEELSGRIVTEGLQVGLEDALSDGSAEDPEGLLSRDLGVADLPDHLAISLRQGQQDSGSPVERPGRREHAAPVLPPLRELTARAADLRGPSAATDSAPQLWEPAGLGEESPMGQPSQVSLEEVAPEGMTHTARSSSSILRADSARSSSLQSVPGTGGADVAPVAAVSARSFAVAARSSPGGAALAAAAPALTTSARGVGIAGLEQQPPDAAGEESPGDAAQQNWSASVTDDEEINDEDDEGVISILGFDSAFTSPRSARAGGAGEGGTFARERVPGHFLQVPAAIHLAGPVPLGGSRAREPRHFMGDSDDDRDDELTQGESSSGWGLSGDVSGNRSHTIDTARSGQLASPTAGAQTGLANVLQRMAVDNFSFDETLGRSIRRVLQLGTVLAGQRLTEEEIRALPRVRFESADLQSCPICLEVYQRGEFLTALRCTHFFHVDCLTTWFQHSTQCPLCRTHAD